jgi:hypothetical protein
VWLFGTRPLDCADNGVAESFAVKGHFVIAFYVAPIPPRVPLSARFVRPFPTYATADTA